MLTRQDLKKKKKSGKEALKGGYVLSNSQKEDFDLLLLGSGSEMEMLVKAQKELLTQNIDARVVSMPCMELFDRQKDAYKEEVLPNAMRNRISAEAGCSMPWYKYIGLDGKAIAIDHYGASAPANILFEKFNFTPEYAVEEGKKLLNK